MNMSVFWFDSGLKYKTILRRSGRVCSVFLENSLGSVWERLGPLLGHVGRPGSSWEDPWGPAGGLRGPCGTEASNCDVGIPIRYPEDWDRGDCGRRRAAGGRRRWRQREKGCGGRNAAEDKERAREEAERRRKRMKIRRSGGRKRARCAETGAAPPSGPCCGGVEGGSLWVHETRGDHTAGRC